MKLSNTAPALAMLTTLLSGAECTHKIGDKCTDKKYRNTYGCSNDDCVVVKCVPLPNAPGRWYWAHQNVCKGIECQNGACNSEFENAKCGT